MPFVRVFVERNVKDFIQNLIESYRASGFRTLFLRCRSPVRLPL